MSGVRAAAAARIRLTDYRAFLQKYQSVHS